MSFKPETIAALAWRMIEKKLDDEQIDQSDLTGFRVPGSLTTTGRDETYRQRTYRIACHEALELLEEAQRTVEA